MPSFVRIVYYWIAAILLALALVTAWAVVARGASIWAAWFSLLCIVALVGLLRRVTWGRFLVSFISVLGAFSIAALLTPNDYDLYNGCIVFEQIFGFMPPVWLSGLVVVLGATSMLLPAVVIGWRKDWFRSKSW